MVSKATRNFFMTTSAKNDDLREERKR